MPNISFGDVSATKSTKRYVKKRIISLIFRRKINYSAVGPLPHNLWFVSPIVEKHNTDISRHAQRSPPNSSNGDVKMSLLVHMGVLLVTLLRELIIDIGTEIFKRNRKVLHASYSRHREVAQI